MRSERSNPDAIGLGARGLCGLLAAALVLSVVPTRAYAYQVVIQTDPSVQGSVSSEPPPPPAGYAEPQAQVVYEQPQARTQVVYAQPGYDQGSYVQPVAVQPARGRSDAGPRVALIVSGSVMLALGWLANGLAGIFAGYNGSHANWLEWRTFREVSPIPLIGPWLQLAYKPTRFDYDGWGGWLVFDGILQAAGLALLVTGIVLPSDDAPVADLGGGVRFTVVPTSGPDQLGLAAIGTF